MLFKTVHINQRCMIHIKIMISIINQYAVNTKNSSLLFFFCLSFTKPIPPPPPGSQPLSNECHTNASRLTPGYLGTSKAYGDLELHQRSSKSLLANVLDLEDNALASHNNLLNNVYSTPGPHHHHHTTPHHHHHPHTATTTPHHQHQTPMAHSSYPQPPHTPGHQLGHTPHHHAHPPDATGGPQVETILQSACFCARYELVLILKEIKVIITVFLSPSFEGCMWCSVLHTNAVKHQWWLRIWRGVVTWLYWIDSLCYCKN